MIVSHAENSVIASAGTGTSSTFKIATNAHAFKMLSSGLYSDKISAVLREIGCNAADAHIAGGIRDTPIEVKLPNQLSPLFYIKDFGPGLPESEIRELYSTYFASTKQASNDFTGAFGLGSKSPFSYTDSFTITSCYEGEMKTYIAHLDKNGSPVITYMNTNKVESNWKTGVRISFPVKVADFAEFQEKARNIYQWFSPLPRVLGLEPHWRIEKPSWSNLNSLVFFTEDEKPSILMGNVRYPLDSSKLFPAQSWQAKTNLEVLSAKSILLKLPIGAIQVAGSREDIQYDEDSRLALKEALTTAHDELCAKAVSLLSSAYTKNLGWRRAVAVYATYEAFPDYLKLDRIKMEIWQKLRGSTTICSADVDALIKLTGHSTVPLPATVTSVDKGVSVKALSSNLKRAGLTGSIVHSGKIEKAQKFVTAELNVAETTTIYVGDCDKAEDRLRVYLSGSLQKNLSVLLVYCRGKDKRGEAQAYADDISTTMAGIPVIAVSSLPELATPVKEKTTAVVARYLKLKDSYTHLPPKVNSFFGTGEDILLSSVPSNGKYFLVREGPLDANSTNYFFEYLSKQGQRIFDKKVPADEGAVSFFSRVAKAFGSIGMTSSLPDGFILVTPTQVEKLKLLNLGFKPVMGYFRELVQSDAFANAVAAKGISGFAKVFNLHSTMSASILLNLVAQSKDSDAYDILMAQPLPEKDRGLFKAIREAPELGDVALNSRLQLEGTFGPFWEFFAIPETTFILGNQICDSLEARYPALKLLSFKKLRINENKQINLALPFIFAQLPKAPVVQLELLAA